MDDHNGPRSIERFWSRVDVSGVCWEWGGPKDPKGYGRTSIRNADGSHTGVKAHRRSYFLLVGDIPDGLTVDHVCRNTGCVNPDHFEIVTASENSRRANREVGVCINGHEYTERDTVPSSSRGVARKRCRQCQLVKRHQQAYSEPCGHDSFCSRRSHIRRKGHRKGIAS